MLLLKALTRFLPVHLTQLQIFEVLNHIKKGFHPSGLLSTFHPRLCLTEVFPSQLSQKSIPGSIRSLVHSRLSSTLSLPFFLTFRIEQVSFSSPQNALESAPTGPTPPHQGSSRHRASPCRRASQIHPLGAAESPPKYGFKGSEATALEIHQFACSAPSAVDSQRGLRSQRAWRQSNGADCAHRGAVHCRHGGDGVLWELAVEEVSSSEGGC